MKDLGKILRINLLILLGYSVLFLLLNNVMVQQGQDTYSAMGFAILMMMALGLHLVVNLVLMIVRFVQDDHERGLSYLVSLFVVAVVGFSSCLGGSALF